MTTAYSKVVWMVGLMGVSMVALADGPKVTPPQEPAGFVTGAVVGGFAAGPIGAVVGAGIGTWLGNRVHRASEAANAQAEVVALRTDNAQLQIDKAQLQTDESVLLAQTSDLAETNRALTARLDQLSHSVDAAREAKEDAPRDGAAAILDGLQGDVLFRTGSADIAPDMAHAIQTLADAVAKSPALKVRVDGYADPRGTVDANLKLSQARADAVRDVFLAAGLGEEALEINAYGKSQSVAEDVDGYALERRVRLTLQAAAAPPVARSDADPPASNSIDTGPTGENE